MTNSLSSVLFPRFRPTQGTYADSRDAAVPNDKASICRSATATVRMQPSQTQELSNVAQASDETLMAMLGSGGQEAIGHLFRRYATTIHAIGKRILRDATEAEDLVQEVFLYVFRKSKVYDASKGSARSWLIQVAYSQAFIRRRKLKTLGFYEDGQSESDIPRSAGSEVEAFSGHTRWELILEDLTGDQEQVLILHFYEGYTFSEIADKLGQSYANVRNHYYRGLEKLRKHIAKGKLNVL